MKTKFYCCFVTILVSQKHLSNLLFEFKSIPEINTIYEFWIGRQHVHILLQTTVSTHNLEKILVKYIENFFSSRSRSTIFVELCEWEKVIEVEKIIEKQGHKHVQVLDLSGRHLFQRLMNKLG